MPDTPAPLYTHVAHPHTPKNVNEQHQASRMATVNGRIASAITRLLGSMWCAYLFVFLAVLGFPGFQATAPQYVQWISQTFIQLVALSVLQVGSNLLSQHAELQANEQYQTTQHTLHDTEQIANHLTAQDTPLQAIHASITDLHAKVDALSAQTAPPPPPDAPAEGT